MCAEHYNFDDKWMWKLHYVDKKNDWGEPKQQQLTLLASDKVYNACTVILINENNRTDVS